MSANATENLDDETEFDLELEGEGAEIEEIDDTPEGDRGRALLAPEDEDLEPTPEDELASYSDRVKKRISEATFKFNDQRRKREAAERERDEAVKFAKLAVERINQYNSALTSYEKFGVDQAKGRVEAQLTQARNEYKAAYESGDADALAEAAEKIARLAPQHEQYSRYVPADPEPVAYEPDAYRQVQAQPDPRAQEAFSEWHSQNQWFGQDPQMTLFARGWHTMVAEQNPSAVGTPEYYREIDRLVRENFPDRFADRQQQSSQRTSRSSPVTPVTRASPSGKPSGKRKITLTQSQIKLASRLGLTPQQYAESLIEEEKNQ